MKKLIAAMAISLFGAHCVYAEDSQPPHITVFGTATTEVIPDQMRWFLHVENRGPSLDSVAAEHTSVVGSVLDLLKKSKADQKSVQTSRMEFGENWEYRNNSRVREGYIASTDISFKLTDFDGYTALWSALSRNGAVSVTSVTYDHSQRIRYQNQTRENAAVAAREKAKTLAHALDSEIQEPLVIEEELSINEGFESARNNLRNASLAVGGGAEASNALAPGTIPITVRVKTTFRLAPSKH